MHRDDLRAPRRGDLHLAAGIDTDPGEIARVDAQRRFGDESLQQRRLRHQATIVVQRATHHEAQSVRVAGRRLGLAGLAVPDVERGRVDGRRCLGRVDHLVAFARVGGLDRGRAFDLDRVPGGARTVVGHDRQVARAHHDLVEVRGHREDHSVARGFISSAVTPACAALTRAISSVTSSTVARSRSSPSRSASSAAMRQSSIAVPSGATLRPTRWTLPFEVRHGAGLLAPQRARQEHVGPARRLRCEPVDRDDRVDRVDRAPRECGVGEVADRIGADQNQHSDLAVGRGA